MRADPMERVSQGAGFGMVVAVSVLLVLGALRPIPPLPAPPKQETFVVALQAPPPEPPAPVHPPAPMPPPPKRVPPPPKPRPVPVPAPVHATTAPTPVAAPKPAPVPPPQATPPSQPAPLKAEPTPPAPVAPPVNNASLENSFVGKLRSYIRSITQYPPSGEARRLRPEGAVEVSFTLSRAGAVSNVSVVRTSNSPILDKQAVAIVESGSYPAIPADAWTGENAHAFTVTVEFSAP